VSAGTPGQAKQPAWLVTDFDGYWKAQDYDACAAFGQADLADAFEAGMQAQRDLAAREPQPAPERFAAEVRRAPCPVAGHDGEHFQWRTGDWVCGHVLAASLALAGIVPPPEIGAAAREAQPAPGLAAATAQARLYLDALTTLRDVLLRDGDHLAARRHALQVIDSLELPS